MAKGLDKTDWGLFFLRLGIGFGFACIHGLPKLLGGVSTWEKLGANMGHFGIHWQPVFWGFMAMSAEFFGGILLMLGLLVRPAAAIMIINMIVAAATMLYGGHTHKDMAEIFEIFGALSCLLIMGGGNISLRGLLRK